MKKINIKHLFKFIWAIAKHIYDRMRKLEGIEYEMRLHECMQCEEMDGAEEPWEHCNACGCHIRTKASWKSERCPRGKWYER